MSVLGVVIPNIGKQELGNPEPAALELGSDR